MPDKTKTTALPQPFTGVKGAKAPNVPMNAVTIYNVETGEAAHVKPINATEAVEGGFWSYEPQTPKTPESSDKDARSAELGAMKKDALVDLAGDLAGASDTKADLVAKILAQEFPED